MTPSKQRHLHAKVRKPVWPCTNAHLLTLRQSCCLHLPLFFTLTDTLNFKHGEIPWWALWEHKFLFLEGSTIYLGTLRYWQLRVIHIGEIQGTFGFSPKSKFLLCVRKLELAQVHSGAAIKAHKGEPQDFAICWTITNESGQLCMLLMCPGEPGRSSLSTLLYYSPNTSSQHLLFSGLCPWEQNKLNNFFLQHLMNINTFFIYCLANMTKIKMHYSEKEQEYTKNI